MDSNKKDYEEIKEGACQEDGCFRDPADALLDLSKMTSEEMREYLNELFRNRSFGC